MTHATADKRIRLALTADLHYGITSAETIAALVDSIAAAGCDAVLLAGDIGEPADNFRAALELFADLPPPRVVVAGNHDLWAGDYPSRYLWDDVLPHISSAAGCTWLDRENLIIGDTGICGTIGWYDYSAGDPRLADYDDSRYSREKPKFNMDGLRIDWSQTDAEFAAEILAAFHQRITVLQNNPAVKHIVVLTHVPPFEEQLIRKPLDDFLWNVNNAYFGNLTLGREILRHDKVRLVVSGHTHVGVDATISPSGAEDKSIRVITVGSGYFKPKLQIVDLDV